MFTALLPTYTKVQMVPCTYKSRGKKKVLFRTFLEKLKVERNKNYFVGYRFQGSAGVLLIKHVLPSIFVKSKIDIFFLGEIAEGVELIKQFVSLSSSESRQNW